MPILTYIKTLLVVSFFAHFSLSAKEQVLQELDAYWQYMATTVSQGDFEGYASTFHPDAVFVTDIVNTSYPIGNALARWQQGFVDTKAGKMQAGVDFKFTQSLVSENTAHQTGYFYYYSIDSQGKKTPFIAYFKALLVKKSGKWQMMMEHHIKQVDQQIWDNIN